MADKIFMSKGFLAQARRDHEKLKTLPRPDLTNTYNTNKRDRIFARITGKLNDSEYPLGATYRGIQVIGDSNGEFQDLTQTWGEGTTGSWTPIIDIVSLGPYHINDSEFKRIPDDTIVEVFYRGNNEGNKMWYCEPPEQTRDIAFGASLIDVAGTEKVRINTGRVYGKDFSTPIATTSINTSANLWVYVKYTITFATYAVSVNGIFSQSSRPVEYVDTSTTRTVSIPLCSFDSDLIMHRYWEGDIDVGAAYGHWYADSNSPLDLTFDSEHQEAAFTDSGWDRTNQGSYSGLIVTIQTGVSYYESGDEKLYAYYKDFTYDGEGKLLSVTSEVRAVVETPETCP